MYSCDCRSPKRYSCEPPEGPPPAWMAVRPAGIRAFVAAIREHRIAPHEYARFTAPRIPAWQARHRTLFGTPSQWIDQLADAHTDAREPVRIREGVRHRCQS
jgi:hypothetical protein